MLEVMKAAGPPEWNCDAIWTTFSSYADFDNLVSRRGNKVRSTDRWGSQEPYVNQKKAV